MFLYHNVFNNLGHYSKVQLLTGANGIFCAPDAVHAFDQLFSHQLVSGVTVDGPEVDAAVVSGLAGHVAVCDLRRGADF